jgi:hypothetical protein
VPENTAAPMRAHTSSVMMRYAGRVLACAECVGETGLMAGPAARG